MDAVNLTQERNVCQFKGARSRYFKQFQGISALIKIDIELTRISK